MVQGEFLHLGAGVVWDVGRRFHFMYDQHPGCGYLPSHGMDSGTCSPKVKTKHDTLF